MDEFEIEVSSLLSEKRSPRQPTMPPEDDPGNATPRGGPPPAPLLPLSRLRPLLRDRARQVRSLGAAGAVLAALLVVLANSPTGHEGLAGLLNVPTTAPTATLEPGMRIVYVFHDVPWGTLTIDGKPQPLPYPTPLRDVRPYVLARGRHVFGFEAAPFPSLFCHLSVPADVHDDCPLGRGTEGGEVGGAVRKVDLGAVPSRLDPTQRVSLEAAMTQTLRSVHVTTTIQTGERYLLPDGTLASAAAPITATLVFDLDRDTSSFVVNESQCAPLCDDSIQAQGEDAWLVNALVTFTWRYTFADGHALDAPPSRAPQAQRHFGPLVGVPVQTFRVAWGGDWQVSSSLRGYRNPPDSFSGTTCSVAGQGYADTLNAVTHTLSAAVSTEVLSAPNPADGCVFLITPADVSGQQPSPLAPSALLFLYRFGVLYAASDAARQAAPDLPVVRPSQQTLAIEIVKRGGL